MLSAIRKRASIHTLGCRLNQAESALLAESLTAAGYEITPFGEPADLGVIHTCTVTQEADAKSRKLVRQFIRRNPEAYTAVIGCYAQMGANTLADIPGIDLIIGNQEKLHLLDYVAAGKNESPLIVRDRFVRGNFSIDFAATDTPLSRRANLKVQDGCDFMCSFCIIPFARGRARSRDLDNLLAEARSLVARGAKEIVLTGVNLGLYDYSGHSLLDVVDQLNEIDGLARIRISSIEPTTAPEALLDRMADRGHRLVPYLHLPMQSGADRVLAAMRRKYTRQEYLNFARMAYARVPELGVGTDILVGFPDETDADFEETCSLFEESPCFYAHVFKYSERDGAAAARMGNAVDPRAAGRRSARIRKLSAMKERNYCEQHLGRTLEVLFEHKEGPYWTGYTENYIRVAVRSEVDLTNRLLPVQLTHVHLDTAIGVLPETAGHNAPRGMRLESARVP